MSLATLTLHFNVTGTNVALADVRRMSMGIAGAATQLEGGWLKAANMLEGSLHRITNRMTTIATIGGGIFVAGIYKMTQALLGLGGASVMVNQQFQEFEITLSSSLKSVESARKITQEVAKITAYSPIPFKDIASTVTGLSVLPQLNARFVSESQRNQLSETNGLLRRSIRLVEMMTAFRPDKNPDEALFSIREALAGEFRSIQRRFDVPLSIFTNASGLSIQQLKERGPDAIFDALFKAFDNIVSSSAIAARAKLPTVTIDNFWEQIFQMPSLAVGRAGWNKTLNERLFKYLENATFFFTENPEIEGSGQFVTKKYAERIAISVNRIFGRITIAFESSLDRLLRTMGFGDRDVSLFERSSQAVEAGFRYVSDNLPKWISYAKEVFDAVYEVLQTIYEWIKPIISFMVAHPNIAAATAVIGPGNILRAAGSLAARGAVGTLAGGSALVGGVFSAAVNGQHNMERFFQMNAAGTQMRATTLGAQILNSQGMTSASGGAFRAGQMVAIPTATAAMMGAQAGGAGKLFSLSAGGLTGAAGFLAVIGLTVVSLNKLGEAAEEAAKTLVAIKRSASINKEAIPGAVASGVNLLSQYAGSPMGDSALTAGRSLEFIVRKAVSGDTDARNQLLNIVGAKLVTPSFDPENPMTNAASLKVWSLNGKEFSNPDDPLLLGEASTVVVKMIEGMHKSLIAVRGGLTVTQEKARDLESMVNLLKETGEFLDTMSVMEKNFGLAEFNARIASTGQLAASRLSTENLPFLESFWKNADPAVILRENLRTFGKIQDQVNKDLLVNQRSLEGLTSENVVRFLTSKVAHLRTLASKGLKQVEVLGTMVDVESEIARLMELVTEASGYGSGADIVTRLKADLNRARGVSVSQTVDANLAGLLTVTDLFKSGAKNTRFGPEFELKLSQLSEGLDAVTDNIQDQEFTSLAQVMKKQAAAIRFDDSQMNDVERIEARLKAGHVFRDFNSTLERMVEIMGEMTAAANGGATSLDSVNNTLKALAGLSQKELEQLFRDRQEFERIIFDSSLDSAHNGVLGGMTLNRLARGRGFRVSTDSERHLAEIEAITGDYGPFDGLGKGFSSQFKVGDDFMNMAREGIALAQTMKGAFADAFSSIVLGTESVGQAFRNMAASIIDAMARIFAQKAAEMLLNAVFGSFSFGSTASSAASSAPTFNAQFGKTNTTLLGIGKAAGGFINAGRGGIDDVPALLMRGEYVLNERAVRAIGVHNLDAWNSGRFSRYGNGGQASLNYTLPQLTAHTAANQYHLGDIHYHSSGRSTTAPSGSMTPQDLKDFQRQHRAMTYALIEEYERKKAMMGR